MNKGELGLYSCISMTKVDFLEHNKNELDIKITAIHEYIHSYLIRTSLYGNFISGLININNIEKEETKYESILLKNQRKLQETVATLTEIIYVWYKCGYAKANNYYYKLPNEYQSFIRKYKYIINEEYILGIYSQYIEYTNKVKQENKSDKELCEDINIFCNSIKDTSDINTALNLLLYLILETAEISLMIDVSDIYENCDNVKDFEKDIESRNAKKYNPNYRFKEYIKYLLPRDKKNKAKFDISNIIDIPEELGTELIEKNDNCILKMYEDYNSVDLNRSKNILEEPEYKVYPRLNKVSDFENEAILYAQPYPLNKESIKKLFGSKIESKYYSLDKYILNNFLKDIEILHIHPAVGSEEKVEYEVTINNTLNRNAKLKFENNFVVNNINLYCNISKKSHLFKLLQLYKGDLLFTGCHRTKDILLEMKERQINNCVFINSVSSITTSIPFINDLFKGNDGEVVSSIYGDILLMKNDNIIFFQCMLPSCVDILNKNIINKRIELNRVNKVDVDELTIVNNAEWNKIMLALEYYFKGCASHVMK